jgi:hypothetical protein
MRTSLGIGAVTLRPIRAAGLKLGRDGACSLELPPRSKSLRSRGEPDRPGRGAYPGYFDFFICQKSSGNACQKITLAVNVSNAII